MISRFDNIRVVLAEPRSSLRGEIKKALNRIGFQDIVDSGNLSTVREAVEKDVADLLIVDTSLPEGDVNKLIYRMRHGEVGENPFLVVVALVSEPSELLIRETIDSGADDIAIKPFTMDYLCQRILSLTHSRKRFVVTTDYIGPDRRDKRRAEDLEIPQIIVPNPLRIRVTGQVGSGKMKRSIETAAATINEQKVQRHGFQVHFLTQRILPKIRNGQADAGVAADLEKLFHVASDLAKRSKGSSFSHVREMCLTLVNMVESVRRDPVNADPLDLSLLDKLSEIIRESFDPDRNEKRDAAAKEMAKERQAKWEEENQDNFLKKIEAKDEDESEEETETEDETEDEAEDEDEYEDEDEDEDESETEAGDTDPDEVAEDRLAAAGG